MTSTSSDSEKNANSGQINRIWPEFITTFVGNQIFEVMPIIPFRTDSRFLEDLRLAVLQYARKNYGSSGLYLEDLVQDALLTAYENVHQGKLTELTSSLKTYVIKIFENKANAALRENKKLPILSLPQSQDSDDEALDPIDIGIAEKTLKQWEEENAEEEQEQLQTAVREVVGNLKEPCKTILWSFYWEVESMKHIAELMNYNTADVAKTQKSKCMTKVKVAFEESIKRMRS